MQPGRGSHMGHSDLAADRRECCASIGLALIAFGAATGRGAALAAATGPVVGEAGGDQPAFPLAVGPGRRYLEDAAGRPRVGAGFDPAGAPSVVIRNEQGQPIWQVPPAAPAP